MSSPKLERAKQNNPGLSNLLDRLGAYVRRQVQLGQSYILPKLAAASLKINDGEAFVLLELLTKAGLLQRVYNVYCRGTDTLLATVPSTEALSQVPRCDECDSEHAPSEMRVQIAFRPNSGDFADTATR